MNQDLDTQKGEISFKRMKLLRALKSILIAVTSEYMCVKELKICRGSSVGAPHAQLALK